MLASILVLAGLVLVTTAAWRYYARGAGANEPEAESAPGDGEPPPDRARRQAAEQWSDAHLTLRQPLDFGPFAATLNAVPAHRTVELDALLLNADIPDLAAMMAAGTLSAEALTLYYLERIRRYDGTYHAVLELNPGALEAARALDAERAAGSVRGLLHGIPLLLKDNIATGDGMANTAGAAALAGALPGRDAFIAERLREEGAIFLGKTNMSEWANFMTRNSVNGFSALGGPTRNPYGRFDVSGSSSGSAAAVALRFAAAAVGTETIGSVIAPASANSLAGVRPTLGLVSRDLIIPITDRLDSAGPITRSVTDAAVLLGPLSAVDPADEFSPRAAGLHGADFTAALDAGALRGTRVGLLRFQPDEGERWDAGALLRGPLEQAGAAVVEVELETAALESIDALAVLTGGMRRDVDAYLAATNTPVRSLAEVVAFNAADPAARAPYGQDLLEASVASTMSAEAVAALAEQHRVQMAGLIRDLMERHEVEALVGLGNSVSLIYALAGAPAVTVPAGYSPEGAPFGATFFAEPGSDARMLAFAYAFEQSGDGRREPAPVEGEQDG
jgi:amidase